MPYTVAIRNNGTGEIRYYKVDDLWDRGNGDTDLYWWTRGNYSCDCNRELAWVRASGPGPIGDPHWNDYDTDPCGETRFSVLHAELPDGTRIQIDKD